MATTKKITDTQEYYEKPLLAGDKKAMLMAVESLRELVVELMLWDMPQEDKEGNVYGPNTCLGRAKIALRELDRRGL